MNPLIQRETTILPVLIGLALACFALAPLAEGTPPPKPEDRGNGNSAAENVSALNPSTTGSNNTAHGWFSLFSNTTGSFNTATGDAALSSNTTGSNNTANGLGALLSNTTGSANTATGNFALAGNTAGGNTANGASALVSNTLGQNNTAVGVNALSSNATGSFNVALGSFAGGDLTIGDDNIDIGNSGFAGENGTIRIGEDIRQLRTLQTFIAGIRGRTTGNADAIPVLIDSLGQLGTASSSRRFKKEIKPMDSASEAILAFKPVTFHYKSDKRDTPQFGLIAEEVAKVNPDLVVRDKNGEIYTVHYDAVNAMLLNEFLKEHSTVQELKKEIAALTATVKEQAAQIQKVSAQLEVSKPAPQTVNNNQ
jgi:Chaperone of endosialidase